METKKPIAIASDHGGYALKLEIETYFQTAGIPFCDYGCDSPDRADYPVYANRVSRAMVRGNSDFGILVCGTGIGMSMAANKVKGIRAACCSDSYSARMTRAHNNANILCLGGRVIAAPKAIELVRIFLSTPFDGGRHADRIGMFGKIEENQELE